MESEAVDVVIAMSINTERGAEEKVADNELPEQVKETIETIDQDGTQITKAIAAIVVQDMADTDVINQLHDELSSLLRERSHEVDAVSMHEVAMALWFELRYIAETMDDKEGAETGASSTNGGVGSESPDDDDWCAPGQTDPDAGERASLLGFDGGESDEPPTDPAFQ
ncbi:hypothetical protein ATJ93_4636 [Halopiger aswanensis]|uniref:Uncharacterized protein n=2 Tax=Halopiger aswanensis TaxID=148449 RepID=A0A419VVM6_9EURY|nr:hypothetical protein ATJ93_4636 [Halopiger aswanensis]